jgi:hypothetical protein
VPSGKQQREVRVVDPETGGAKGSKQARFDLLPWDALYALAEHFGDGSKKYADRNWEKSYAWGLSRAALGRHFASWSQGEDYDEDGRSHIVAVLWHASVLTAFWLRGIGTDDRPRTGIRTPNDLDAAGERGREVRGVEERPSCGLGSPIGPPDPWAFYGHSTPSSQPG